MKNKTTTLLLIILTTVSCSILTRAPKTIDASLPAEPLTLKSAVELTNLRIDLHREKTTEETGNTKDDGTKETKEVEVDYHPLGFFLTENIFFDLNNNLSLSVPRLFGVSPNNDFEITEYTPGLFSEHKKIVIKNGGTIERINKGLIIDSRKTTTITNDKIVIEEKLLFPVKRIIDVSPELMTYQVEGILSKSSLKKIQKTTDGYKVPSMFRNQEYTQPNQKKIILDRNFQVVKSDRQITILRYNKPYIYMFKTTEGYTITFSGNSDLLISVDSKQIEEIRYGRLQKKYERTY